MKIELFNVDSIDRAKKEIISIGADSAAVSLMDKKFINLVFKVYGCKFYYANLLKQEALSLGMDAAIEKGTITADTKVSDCLIFGDIKRLIKLSEKLKRQSFKTIRELGYRLKHYIDGVTADRLIFRYRDNAVDLKSKFLIMGILNVTPDSFSDGGIYTNLDSALRRVEDMIEEGADIVDVGGESTRPGSDPVSIDDELNRVMPVVEAIKKRFDIAISVDTYKSKVADEALKRSVEIINDISGLNFDKNMVNVLAASNCGIVAMHIKGEPKNMQKNPSYKHILAEINEYFESVLDKIEKNSIDKDRVILDPGIGFGKTFDDNYKILNNIKSFRIWGRPILVGVSRKSFIGHTLNEPNPQNRIVGSVSANVVSFMNGARIFRVHDVKETYDALKIAQSIMNEKVYKDS
jgi:dihydropteroate synthase